MKSNPYHNKAAFFDGQIDAAWAADAYGPEERRKLERLRGELAPLAGKSILEPGCGTGRMTEVLSQWVGPSGAVTALDISPKMIARAKQRLAGRENISQTRAALEDIAFRSACFDVVLHHQVFPHYHNPARVLDITARVVKPGGAVILCHFINSARMNDIHRKAGSAVAHDLMPKESELRRLFSAAGLTVKFVADDDNGFFLSAHRPI
jgi:ubiquinone/menaquinone biosynthesis C-methylase UbiE